MPSQGDEIQCELDVLVLCLNHWGYEGASRKNRPDDLHQKFHVNLP